MKTINDCCNAAEKTVKLLKENGFVLTTAESCTGGLISKLITDISGSSEVFKCGIVAYANEIKEAVLGVKGETLKKFGAVSRETVTEMAQGALKISGADIAVSVSGIAGPSSDDTNKPVGLIWLAVSFRGQTKTAVLNNNFTGNIRENNRISAAYTALTLVCEAIESNKRV